MIHVRSIIFFSYLKAEWFFSILYCYIKFIYQAVLERGVMTFFNSRADASSGVRRRDYKYLDGAKVTAMLGGDGAMFVIQYNDGTSHRLSATPDPVHSASVNRQVRNVYLSHYCFRFY